MSRGMAWPRWRDGRERGGSGPKKRRRSSRSTPGAVNCRDRRAEMGPARRVSRLRRRSGGLPARKVAAVAVRDDGHRIFAAPRVWDVLRGEVVVEPQLPDLELVLV